MSATGTLERTFKKNTRNGRRGFFTLRKPHFQDNIHDTDVISKLPVKGFTDTERKHHETAEQIKQKSEKEFTSFALKT